MIKRFAVMIAIAGMFLAAAFGWQASVFAMSADHGHDGGMDCLSYCLLAGSDDAGAAAATIVLTVTFAVTLSVWYSLAAILTRSDRFSLFGRAGPAPARRFLIARLD